MNVMNVQENFIEITKRVITILLPLEVQHRLSPLNLSSITNQVVHLLSRFVDESHMTDGSNLIQ